MAVGDLFFFFWYQPQSLVSLVCSSAIFRCQQALPEFMNFKLSGFGPRWKSLVTVFGPVFLFSCEIQTCTTSRVDHVSPLLWPCELDFFGWSAGRTCCLEKALPTRSRHVEHAKAALSCLRQVLLTMPTGHWSAQPGPALQRFTCLGTEENQTPSRLAQEATDWRTGPVLPAETSEGGMELVEHGSRLLLLSLAMDVRDAALQWCRMLPGDVLSRYVPLRQSSSR